LAINHDKGKRNMADRRWVHHSHTRFQVTAINGKLVADAFILIISSLGVKIECSNLIIPPTSMKLQFLVPGAGRANILTWELEWLVEAEPSGINLMEIPFHKPYRKLFWFMQQFS
jgi:hypothetical protein